MRAVFGTGFSVNSELVFNAEELFEQFLPGIPRTMKNGDFLADSVVESAVKRAQDFVQSYLNVRIFLTVVEKSQDYDVRQNFRWMEMAVDFPIVMPLRLVAKLTGQTVITFPQSWLNTTTSSYQQNSRRLAVVPAGSGSAGLNMAVMNLPFFYSYSATYVPNYMTLTYLTGFDPIPPAIQEAVGWISAMEILNMLGVVLFGLGVGSESISFDGLSQSISTLKAGPYGAFSDRISMIKERLQSAVIGGLPLLQRTYGGGRPMVVA